MKQPTITWKWAKAIAKTGYDPQTMCAPVVKRIGGKEFILNREWGNFDLRMWDQKFKNCLLCTNPYHEMESYAKDLRGRGMYAQFVKTNTVKPMFPEGATSLYLRPKNMKDQKALNYIMDYFPW